jgi:hypothetical protein
MILDAEALLRTPGVCAVHMQRPCYDRRLIALE